MSDASHEPAAPTVVLDWDGTVTERDTLHMVVGHFGDAELFAALEDDLSQRRLPLNEVIRLQMATVTAPLADVVEWLLAHVRVRPGLARLVAEVDPLIVSAGFRELIDPILEREGVRVRVEANSLDADPAGWRTLFAPRTTCDVCEEPCKRSTVADVEHLVYVGDGVSDRCVSLRAERVFARAGLADWLAARSVPFERFSDLDDVRRGLQARPGSHRQTGTEP